MGWEYVPELQLELARKRDLHGHLLWASALGIALGIALALRWLGSLSSWPRMVLVQGIKTTEVKVAGPQRASTKARAREGRFG